MNTDYSPSQLMNFAERGMLARTEMADLLPEDPRAEFLTACARVENALLSAGLDYNKACAKLWLPLFRSSQHVG